MQPCLAAYCREFGQFSHKLAFWQMAVNGYFCNYKRRGAGVVERGGLLSRCSA